MSRRILALLLLFVLFTWSTCDTLLSTMGQLLVHEDSAEPVDTIVVSVASPAADALEAAKLYRQGIAPQVVLCTFASGPVDEEIRRLGVPHLRPTELANAILEKSGVDADAIVILTQQVDGTSSEVGAVAAYARQHHRNSLLLVAPRSHTARARWLLRRALPSETRIIVRSPRTDSFDPDDWWRRRAQAREVAQEYLRWINALVLHDPWNRAHASLH